MARNHFRISVPILVVVLAVFTGACTTGGTAVLPDNAGGTAAAALPTPTGTASATATGALPTGTTVLPGPIEPMKPVVPVTGKGKLNAGVVTVPLTALKSVTADGTRMTIDGAAVPGLATGSVFVIPGVAARKVTALTKSGPDLELQTAQASMDEMFQDLDVSFNGTPDPSAITLGGVPVVAPGADPATDFADANAMGSDGAAPASPAPPSKLRDHGGAFAAAPTCSTNGTTAAFSIKDISIQPTFARTADCSGITLGAEIGASTGQLSATMSVEMTVKISNIQGRITAGLSGTSRSATMTLTADGSLGGKAKANEAGGLVSRFKVGWDFFKMDLSLAYLGVPLVLRTGLPFIIEPHFSGRNDFLGGSLISFHCGGTFGIDGAAAKTGQDVCKMNASKLTNALSTAPSGFVVAMGIKFGLGVGVAVGFKAAVFAGVTTTLAVSAGFTYSGAAGAGLINCTRIDRAVTLNLGAEAVAGWLEVGVSRQVWQKTAVDYSGQCPKSNK